MNLFNEPVQSKCSSHGYMFCYSHKKISSFKFTAFLKNWACGITDRSIFIKQAANHVTFAQSALVDRKVLKKSLIGSLILIANQGGQHNISICTFLSIFVLSWHMGLVTLLAQCCLLRCNINRFAKHYLRKADRVLLIFDFVF